MDWLRSRRTNIYCAQETFSFLDDRNQEVLVQGKNGKPKAKLSKAKRLMKGLKSGQQIFVVKLNKIKETESEVEPMWLQEYADVFPEDLTNLPPSREIDHGIEIFPGGE